jgi:hypothetical protein
MRQLSGGKKLIRNDGLKQWSTHYNDLSDVRSEIKDVGIEEAAEGCFAADNTYC